MPAMRSLYTRILLASLATLLLSFVGFVALSVIIAGRSSDRFLQSVMTFEIEHARQVYERGGSQPLGEFLAELDRAFGAIHYFTDAHGKDLISDTDRSGLLPKHAGDRIRSRKVDSSHKVLVKATADGRYYFVVVAPEPEWRNAWTYAPYFALILAAVAVLCWVLALGIARPIRQIAAAVDGFGHGDLSTRVDLRRNDEIGGLAHSFNDMADRTQMLLTAERRLLQDISHELRSPLARLSFGIELARTAPDRDAALNRLKKELTRLTSLVEALLDVTRAEGDPGAWKLRPVHLEEVLREVVEDCDVEAQARNCTLLRPPPVPIVVNGDPELLRRALENIVRNAIRHAPAGTSIEISAQKNGSDAELTIRDYGPGVPEDSLTRIFEPFFRVDNSRDAATGGLGLGLAIANRAIHLHHGRVIAENAHPGLRVKISIPLSGETTPA